MTDTPDYGEPYTAENWRDGAALVNRDGDEVLILESLQRAAACVNACRGIPNPEEVVPLLVEAVLHLHAHKAHHHADNCSVIQAAIAALQPKREGSDGLRG